MTEHTDAVVVLIPGLGNNARLWGSQVEALSDDREIIVADYSGAESIGEMADRVLAQVSAATFSLVGFSLGGYIALRMAVCAAERIHRLALVSTAPYSDSEKARQQREVLICRAEQNYGSLLNDMSRFVIFEDGPHAEKARAVFITMGLELGVEGFCRQQRAAIQRADSRDLLGSIRCPVQVLCGQEDLVTPVSGNRYLAENIPGANLEIIDGAGHLLPLERPAEVNRFLRGWLQ